MIDTLCALVDVSKYDECIKNYIPILEEKKEEAKLIASKCSSEKIMININGLTFQILGNGSKGYAFILHNSEYEVKLAQFRSKQEDFFPIYIRIKSECLWACGYEESWRYILNWISTGIGSINSNKVNRLDLCCHTDNLQLSDDDINTFKGSFHKDEIFRNRRKISGMSFGSRETNNIFCRIYDKYLEVSQKSKKLWFKDIWIKNGLVPEKVWNVEFQLNRTFFKEHMIDSVEDAFARLKTIWLYCTTEWIVKVDLTRSRIERCPTNDAWLSIQTAFVNHRSLSLITRQEQMLWDAEALVPNTIGNLTSFAALLGNDDIETVLLKLKLDGQRYLKNKKTDFRNVVNEKIATHNSKESEVCFNG